MALTDNLVSYWKFEANSNDSVGSNNGTDTAITYSTANGKIGQGAGFNGTTSFIQKASPVGLPSASAARAISLWVKNNSAVDAYFMYYGLLNGHQGFGVANIDEGSGRRTYFISFGGDLDFGVSTEDNVYHHIVVSFDGTTVSCYKDNVFKISGTPVINTSNSNIWFATQDNAAFWMNGALDEIGIWSRTLSVSEISQLYNGGAGLQYPFTVSTANFLNLLGVGT